MPGRVFVAIVALVIAGVGCTDDGASSPTAPLVTVTTTTEPPRPDDGVLRIALLLPETGEGATIGKPLIAAALAAGDAINTAGGVLGRHVQIVGGFDEGDDPSTARDAIGALIEQDFDAVVGPASSNIALATLAQLLDAGILTCSPTATSIALDDFPSRELFFRTAPSDSLEAVAIASQAELTGALSAAVAYLDDGYGRPLAEATITALRANGLTVEDPIGFRADSESLIAEASAVSDSDVGVVIVIGDAEQGTRMLSALGDVTSVVPGEPAPDIIVNDALRRPPSPQLITALSADVRTRVTGVSPSASTGADGEPAGPFASNAFNCVTLIALAAAQARSDEPAAIAAQMIEVSEGGVTCRTFADCMALAAAPRNFDYEGPGGDAKIGPNGDPSTYRYDVWRFDDQGGDVDAGPLSVNR